MGETVSGKHRSSAPASLAVGRAGTQPGPVPHETRRSDGPSPSTARVVEGALAELPAVRDKGTALAPAARLPLSPRASLRAPTSSSMPLGHPLRWADEPAPPSPTGSQPTPRALQAQQSRYARIKAFGDATLRSDFLPDSPRSAAQLDRAKESQGEHFARYREALRVLESELARLRETTPHLKDDVDAVKDACGRVIQQAEAYLGRTSNAYGLTSLRKHGREKLGIVREGLAAARRMSLAMDVLGVRDPLDTGGWDSATAARVAELRAAICFAVTGQQAANFRPDAAPIHWIDSKAPGTGRLQHEFLFKPLDGDLTGRGPVREVLASAMAARFEARSGLHLGVPDTQLVTIESRALKLRRGQADGQPRTGSLQEHVVSKGTLKSQGDEAFQRMPARACQRLAIFDVVCVNLQRHPDNLLVPVAPQDGEFSLALIDHAEAFGGKSGFQTDAIRNCGLVYGKQEHQISLHSALLRMPAAYLPFDEDMLKGLAAVDPAALAQDMREELESLDARHPNLDAGGRVDAERALVADRCLRFLQRAARELSPAGVRIALGRWGFALIEAQPSEFESVAAAAIADIQPKMQAYQTLLAAPAAWQKKAFSILYQKGQWRLGQGLDNWIMEDPDRAVALLPQHRLDAD